VRVRPGKLLSRLDSPLVAALLAVTLGGAFVAGLLRWQYYGDLSRFVLAGDRFSDPATVPDGLFVLRPSAGYDGQFYYRMALAPFSTRRTEHGITLDRPYRHTRLMYPLLVRALSLGQPARVPAAMVQVNLLALGACAALAALLARAMGRHAFWGLLVPLYPGFLLTLARDTTETVAIAFILGGLVLLRRQRPVWAAALLSMAVLTRESTMLVPLAGLMVALATRLQRRSPAPVLPFAVPVAVYAATQATFALILGDFPMRSSEGVLTIPFAAVGHLVGESLAGGNRFQRLHLLEVAWLVAFVALVAANLRASVATALEKTAWLVALAMAVSLSGFVWVEDWAFLRALSEMYALGALIVVGARAPAARWALLAGALLLYARLFYDLVAIGR
jgi:hypothetical protein